MPTSESNAPELVPKQSQWMKFYPYLLVISILTVGYLTGLHLIQIGIPELADSKAHMPEEEVNLYMGIMALISCFLAVISGIFLNKMEINIYNRLCLVILCGGVAAGITIVGNLISTPLQFEIWIILFSIILGITLPIPFTFVYYLIPKNHRGIVAGIITALAYFLGNLTWTSWTFSAFLMESGMIGIPAILLMGWGFLNKSKLNTLDFFHTTKSIQKLYEGRFHDYNFKFFVIVMFGIFFIDSFGFLRIIGESTIFYVTWYGDLGTRFGFAIAHLSAALLMGYLYQKKGPKIVSLATLLGFVIVDSLWALYPSNGLMIVTSWMYCAVVSFYTINTIALWADISEEKNVSSRTAIGIGVCLWLASFMSTAITSQLFVLLPGVTGFQTHLAITVIIAMSSLLMYLVGNLLMNKKKS
jgi:hypothetical protein